MSSEQVAIGFVVIEFVAAIALTLILRRKAARLPAYLYPWSCFGLGCLSMAAWLGLGVRGPWAIIPATMLFAGFVGLDRLVSVTGGPRAFESFMAAYAAITSHHDALIDFWWGRGPEPKPPIDREYWRREIERWRTHDTAEYLDLFEAVFDRWPSEFGERDEELVRRVDALKAVIPAATERLRRGGADIQEVGRILGYPVIDD